jgi:hypothetical protein
VTPGRWIHALVSTWRGRFIAAFVLIQLALPLHYYLARKDRHDERFAWRMFSPMRSVVCSDPDDVGIVPASGRRPPRFTVDGVVVPLGGEFHEAWIETAKRGRYVVIEKMAARLCTRNPGKVVKLSMTCRYLDGSTEDIGGFDLCQVPEL